MNTNKNKSKVSSIYLDDLRYLKGVGEKISQYFKKNEIHTLWDLLLFLPRAYEDRRRFANYKNLEEAALRGESCVIKGRFLGFSIQGGSRFAKARSFATVELIGEESNGEMIQFCWFNKAGTFVQQRFAPGDEVVAIGKVQKFKNSLQLSHPELHKNKEALESYEWGAFIPIYRELGGLSTRQIRKIIYQLLNSERMLELKEFLPESILKNYDFPDIVTAFKELHFPKSWQPTDKVLGQSYLDRLAFEELFSLSLALQLKRDFVESQSVEGLKVVELKMSKADLDNILSRLPFELTQEQLKSLIELKAEMALSDKSVPMNRMLQGDVGAGKTIVAFILAIVALKSGYQVALMAPTQILAEQHYQNFLALFPEYSKNAVFLKSKLKAKEKREAKEKIAKEKSLFVIGTQALLSDSNDFHNLALLIIDEQHRFGVEQRLKLKSNIDDLQPHLLVMTATPIPRSLALTLYGDLKISSIKEKPKNRLAIETSLYKKSQAADILDKIKKYFEEQRQIYIVYPLIEESDTLDLVNVQDAYKKWLKLFPDKKIALLHGRLKEEEKNKVMEEFKSAKIDMLICTTVIEVGVDVPNATVMIINHAERFGLSQLHQLRGRVGRGEKQSYCLLIAPDQLYGRSRERLQTMVESQDGFYISEQDLLIRGPGDFLGKAQSGHQGFKVANKLRDMRLFEEARKQASHLLEIDPKLNKNNHISTRELLVKRWRRRLDYINAG